MKNQHKKLAALIQTARGNNYVTHYETRAVVQTMPADLIAEFAEVAGMSVPFPLLNIYGQVFDGWIPEHVDKLLKKLWTPGLIQIFNPWYLSESGWDGFQRLWKALPEPAELSTDVLISSCRTVDKSLKTVDNLLVSCGKPVDNNGSYPQGKIEIGKIRPMLRKLSTACGKIAELSTELSTGEAVYA